MSSKQAWWSTKHRCLRVLGLDQTSAVSAFSRHFVRPRLHLPHRYHSIQLCEVHAFDPHLHVCIMSMSLSHLNRTCFTASSIFFVLAAMFR